MVLALIELPGCAVTVRDAQFCSLIPGGLGATCDNFLSSNQLLLDGPHWQALQEKWLKSGQAIECTPSNTLGDLKREIEELCSLTSCDYEMQQVLLDGLRKIQQLGRNQTLDRRL